MVVKTVEVRHLYLIARFSVSGYGAVRNGKIGNVADGYNILYSINDTRPFGHMSERQREVGQFNHSLS